MKHTRKIISAIVLSGVLMGCTPADPSSNASTSGSSTTAAATEAGQSTTAGEGTTTPGTQPPVITQAIDPNIILAEGDGISITSGEVEVEFNKMLDSMRVEYSQEMVDSAIGSLQSQKVNILEQFVRNALLDKKGEELGIMADSTQALERYDQIMKDNIASYGGEEQFDQVLTMAGFTQESYKEEVLKSLRYETVAQEVTKEITVSEAEISSTYEEVKAMEYTRQPGATLYHIFFGEPDEAGAEAKAKEAKQKLNDGADFADLAKEYGKDGTAQSGGLLGAFPYQNQELAPDFMNEAIKLKEGEISEPVKTVFGWHLIKAENVQTEPVTLALTDSITLENGQQITVSENIRMNLLNEKRNTYLTELFTQWEETFNVKKYPDQIPMNVPVESEESTEDPADGSTQP